MFPRERCFKWWWSAGWGSCNATSSDTSCLGDCEVQGTPPHLPTPMELSENQLGHSQLTPKRMGTVLMGYLVSAPEEGGSPS